MQIVVLGDIHDRIRNLDKVMLEVSKHAPEVMICTGDLTTPSTAQRLAELFPKEIHLALGNNDDELDIKRTIDRERLLKVYYHGLTGRLTLDKKHVAFTHKSKDAESLLTDDRLDAVFYGHSHEARLEQRQSAWLVNPGDIQGRFGRNPSFVLYDTATGEPTLHEVT